MAGTFPYLFPASTGRLENLEHRLIAGLKASRECTSPCVIVRWYGLTVLLINTDNWKVIYTNSWAGCDGCTEGLREAKSESGIRRWDWTKVTAGTRRRNGPVRRYTTPTVRRTNCQLSAVCGYLVGTTVSTAAAHSSTYFVLLFVLRYARTGENFVRVSGATARVKLVAHGG